MASHKSGRRVVRDESDSKANGEYRVMVRYMCGYVCLAVAFTGTDGGTTQSSSRGNRRMTFKDGQDRKKLGNKGLRVGSVGFTGLCVSEIAAKKVYR